jgi:hypothetical protein
MIEFSSLNLLVLMSFLRLLDLLSPLEPLDGRFPVKRSKGIMEINCLKWIKKTTGHLLLDLRHIDRKRVLPASPESLGSRFAMPSESLAWYKKRVRRLPP